MSRRKPYRPVATGVNFHPAVFAYLNHACRERDCDRSALLNRIVREYATHSGAPIDGHAAAAQDAPSQRPSAARGREGL